MTENIQKVKHKFEHKIVHCSECHRMVPQSISSVPHSETCSQKDVLLFHLNDSGVYDDNHESNIDEKFVNYSFDILFSFVFLLKKKGRVEEFSWPLLGRGMYIFNSFWMFMQKM